MGASPDRHQWGNYTIGAQLFLKGRLSFFQVGGLPLTVGGLLLLLAVSVDVVDLVLENVAPRGLSEGRCIGGPGRKGVPDLRL
jgi:hypothetical protein